MMLTDEVRELYPDRRTPRLPEYDYSSPGPYFVTVCTRYRACLFGVASAEGIVLNESGRLVEACWLAIPQHFPSVRLDSFVVMPNHIHGLLALLPPTAPDARAPALGTVIGSFKSAAARRLRELPEAGKEPIWQERYYEHITRDERDLLRVREYITNNPLRWALDRENPVRAPGTKVDPW